MPTAALKPCSHQPCGNLTSGGPCPTHALQRQRERGSASARGYDRRHQAWRKMVLARHPLCVGYPYGKHLDAIVEATVADHIVPLVAWETSPTLAKTELLAVLQPRRSSSLGISIWDSSDITLDAWSLDNGQGLCARCHNAKTAKENAR